VHQLVKTSAVTQLVKTSQTEQGQWFFTGGFG